MGIPCEYAALGYHSQWGHDLGLRRDVDVVFLGRVRQTSRERVFAHIRRQLRQQGIELTAIERGCYGQDRTKLLNRTRIALDLVQHPWEMPLARLLASMACGALVVSNWTSDPYPFRAEHLVRAESHRLADTILYYLGAESERRRIAEAAQWYVTNELTWDKTVSHLLRVCRQRSPATKGGMT
jgi:spore maturation protein CgeB